MIANLPLLFANGNPTALSSISASELERFITFMVTCSWGHDTARHISQPPWWPGDVPFAHPFARPRPAPLDWPSRLRALVKRCYDFHKSAFLLVFSAQLARYPRARLRYVDNRDHTTSLYYRPSGRLLVTFRNENMTYDRAPRRAPAIYLCDSCDSHFDNEATLRAHERLCSAAPPAAAAARAELPAFLAALRLRPLGAPPAPRAPPPEDSEPRARNGRSAGAGDRGPPYPFSSLAYLKNAKASGPRDLSHSRERAERYCCTSTPLAKLLARGRPGQFPVRYRRPIDHWARRHTFPDQRRKRVLSLAAQLLLLRCRPLRVRVPRLPLAELRRLAARAPPAPPAPAAAAPSPAAAAPRAASPAAADVVLLDEAALEEDPLREEVIDLCSDDEERGTCVMRGGAVLRRTGPRGAGGTGGGGGTGLAPGSRAGPASATLRGPARAILRRTAGPVGPAGPTEPGGAEGPGGAAGPRRLLPPTPLLLIAHSLPGLQTISID